MKEIQLSRGQVALVDDEWFEFLSQWKWQAMKHGRTFYAVRTDRSIKPQKQIRMHRVITAVSKDKEIDHIDNNGLNNCKENLRICSHYQNAFNRTKNSNNTSGHKGVHLHKPMNKWIAKIRVSHKAVHLGLFDNCTDAAHAYDDAAKKYFGEFASLNFP